MAGPPEPVDVDRSWYMDEGPGRYHHPGMFPIIKRIVATRNLAPGTYDLQDFVPSRNERDPLLATGLSNYTTDMLSSDYGLRSFVFGNESARISGQVVVNPDGSKMFKQIEIRPLDINFDFEPNTDPHTNNKLLEGARAIARRIYDPNNQGVSYDIQYRGPGPGYGNGRLYNPFTDAQLGEALQKSAGRPPGLLPSITGKRRSPMSMSSANTRTRLTTTIREHLPPAIPLQASLPSEIGIRRTATSLIGSLRSQV